MAAHAVDHRLMDAWVSELRSVTTGTARFRELARRISAQVTWAAVADIDLEQVEIVTPMSATAGYRVPHPPTVVPVLRAGLAMVDGVTDVVGNGPIRPAGVRRDHDTHVAEWYLHPGEMRGPVIVCDPMIATGGSASVVIDAVRAAGAASITVVGLVAAPEGLARLDAEHPDIDVWVAAIDDHLDDNAYIVPGLGDAGDRWAG